MKPGRELDALVAEKVMGCKPAIKDDDYVCTCKGPNPGYSFDILPHGSTRMVVGEEYPPDIRDYSTDITAAWEVVEHINLLKGAELSKYDNGDWCVGCTAPGEGYTIASGETAPHVICLAALKACRVDIE